MKHFIFIVSVLFFSFIAPAKMQLEPYGGMGVSYSSEFHDSVFLSRVLGIRVGHKFFLFNAGLDLSWDYYYTDNTSIVTLNNPDNTIKGFSQAGKSLSLEDHSNKPGDFKPLSIGVFASVDLPIFSDTFGTVFYTFGKKIKNLPYQGVGVKAGFTVFTVFHVKLNWSVQVAQYFCSKQKRDSESSESSENSNSSESSECKNFNITSTMLTLSLPFSPTDFEIGSSEFNEFNELELARP